MPLQKADSSMSIRASKMSSAASQPFDFVAYDEDANELNLSSGFISSIKMAKQKSLLDGSGLSSSDSRSISHSNSISHIFGPKTKTIVFTFLVAGLALLTSGLSVLLDSNNTRSGTDLMAIGGVMFLPGLYGSCCYIYGLYHPHAYISMPSLD